MANNSLEFKVDTRNLIKYFGEQSFENKYSAVYEVIKNSHDAFAENVVIRFTENSIIIEDDGNGMTREDIINNWMYIGKSHKVDKQSENRHITGEKGIGRFALAKLGRNIVLESKGIDSKAIIWESDWGEYYHLDEGNRDNKGTKIIINNLNDRWQTEDIKKLSIYLAKVKKDTSTNLFIEHNGEKNEIKNIFSFLECNVNYFIEFSFSVVGNVLFYEIKNTLFDDDIYKKEITKSRPHIENSINLVHDEKFKESDIDNLNGINGMFYFGFQITEETRNKFLYKDYNYVKPSMLDEKLDGVILYRNGFSISGFEGTKDWTRMQYRAQKSPAAASHLTGSFRFKKNNILGFVEIDKVKNNTLIDLSNRQGVVENNDFYYLVDIINILFNAVEEYYQGIVRDVDKFVSSEKKKAITPYITQLINEVDIDIKTQKKKRSNMLDLESKVKKELKNYDNPESIKDLAFKKEILVDKVVEKDDNIKQMRYEQRLLEALATQGLLISSLSHDIKVKANDLPTDVTNIRKSLIKMDLWSIVDSPENKRTMARNVPDTLERVEKNANYLYKILMSILENMRKEKFNVEQINIKSYTDSLIEYWKEINASLEIRVVSHIEYILIDEITLDIIFFNLLDNTVKHNPHTNGLIVEISFSHNENGNIILGYRDNGIGLADKYKTNKNKILSVHETSIKSSHGLGLWIVNERVLRSNGKLEVIDTTEGFELNIELKGDMIDE